MEAHRYGHRMTGTRRSQAGVTALGFLVLATLFGVVGLGALKITPMYIKNMRMNTILDDVQRDLNGQSTSPLVIRQELAKRFAVEDINMDINSLKITQTKSGYTLRVAYENRAPYVADIFLVVAYDRQVEIRR